MKQDLGAGRLLDHHRKPAVGAAARWCQHSLREFLLHHENCSVHHLAPSRCLDGRKEHWRGHDVGQVAHHHQRPTGLARGLAKIEFQGVAEHDFEVRPIRELAAQHGRELGVAIDGDDPFRRIGETSSQRSQSRSDLDHHVRGLNLGRGHDAFLHAWVDKKILAQGFLGRKPVTGQELARRRQRRSRLFRDSAHDKGSPGSTLRSSPPRSPRARAQVPASAIMAALSVQSTGVGM